MAVTDPVVTAGDGSDGSIENNKWVQIITVAATVAGLIISLYTIRELMKKRKG